MVIMMMMMMMVSGDLQMEEEFENSQIKTKHYKERTATIKTVFFSIFNFFLVKVKFFYMF
jgi:hypothetical protein